MPRKKDIPPPSKPFRPCEMHGCAEHAEYRAPKSPDGLNDYFWLCLEHVRDYNKSWDYFKGKGMEEIEHFRKEAVTGHRPTWKISDKIVYDRSSLEDALSRMLGEATGPRKPRTPPLPPKIRKSLAALELEHPVSAKDIKAQYKKLVKQHHPDVNRGDKSSEEIFKRINEAHKYLMQHYKPPV